MISGSPAQHPNLATEQIGYVRIVRIDREDKLGALSSDLIAGLEEEVRRIRQDRQVRAVVLTGTGRGFIAGADVSEYHQTSLEAFEEYQRMSRRLFDDVERLPQPVIAAVNGYALGGGFELALSCDFMIASEQARFGLPEIRLGLLPGGGGTQRLARAAGAAWTKELVMTGRTVRPDEAFNRGLVTAVVPHEELRERAMTFALLLAGAAPLALREAKRLIDDGLQQELAAALTNEQRVLARLFSSPDGREGISAFIQKREPAFGQGAPEAVGWPEPSGDKENRA
jgi:enoyl-CoA hydratase